MKRPPPRPTCLPAATVLPLLLAALLAGCAHQTYEPQAVDPAATQTRWLATTTDDEALRQALATQGVDVSRWPLPAWDLGALTGLALQRHPDLAVARASLRSAEAARAAVHQRAGRTAETTAERHSAGGSSGSPWSLGLVLDGWAVGGTDRSARMALVDEADALAQEAAAQAGQTAWTLRQQVRDRQRELHAAGQRRALADAVLLTRRELLAAQEARLARGAVATAEPWQARLAEAEAAALQAAARDAETRARLALAAAVGLPAAALERLPLRFTEALAEPPPLAGAGLQRAALLNRLDLHAALARHAAADAALRAEIARQWPGIVLKPGIAWDQGDQRWSLGIALSLPPGGDNRAAIDQARARRTLEAERVAALQQAALARLDAATRAVEAAQSQRDAAETARRGAQAQQARSQRRLAAGDSDRLETLSARLAGQDAERRLIDAEAARWAALGELEDALQRPLDAAPAEPAVAAPLNGSSASASASASALASALAAAPAAAPHPHRASTP